MRPIFRKLLIAAAVLIVVAVCGLLYLGSRLGPMARESVVQALEEKFKSEVELGSLDLSLMPEPSATATKVLLRHHGRTDVPPLLQIEKLVVKTHFWDLFETPRRVRLVRMEGLHINMPPKKPRIEGGPADVKNAEVKNREAEHREEKQGPGFVVEKIIADGTVLQVLPKQQGREPLTWEIKKLTLQSVGARQGMDFKATLVNAKPPGDIETTGKFGPWNGEDPGQSAVEGNYSFRNADLGVFKGIAGTLSSDGRYNGMLERIEADGTTDTPDFRLDGVNNTVPLKTQFHAIIDGTNGDTLLQPVNAQLGSSSIVCRGGVAGKPGVKGKTITMDVTMAKARIEDILRLTVKSKPAMVGAMRTKAKMVIPPGERDVIEKLRLAGDFYMGDVRFTSETVQKKLEEMSLRARGEPGADTGHVASQFGGDFTLKDGTIGLRGLTFVVPGALARLDGSYGIRNEQIDFAGTLRMQAKVSQTVTGVKSILLKAVDPFFAKAGAGALIPIKITGSREAPKFGLNFGGGTQKEKENERSRKR